MNKRIGNIFKGDRVIWMVFFFLCMISIVEVFSASSGLTYKSQNYIGPIVYSWSYRRHCHAEYPLSLFQAHDPIPYAGLADYPAMGALGRYQGG